MNLRRVRSPAHRQPASPPTPFMWLIAYASSPLTVPANMPHAYRNATRNGSRCAGYQKLRWYNTPGKKPADVKMQSQYMSYKLFVQSQLTRLGHAQKEATSQYTGVVVRRSLTHRYNTPSEHDPAHPDVWGETFQRQRCNRLEQHIWIPEDAQSPCPLR